MTKRASTGFLQIEDADIPGFARASEGGFEVAPAYLAGVIEQLRGLRRHAKRVEAAMAEAAPGGGGLDDPTEAFEP